MSDIITPENYLNYILSLRKKNTERPEFPPVLIASWDPSFIRGLAKDTDAMPAEYCPWGSSLFVNRSKGIGYMTLPVGAPHSVINLELMIAGGVTNIITVGICGTLRADLSAGDIIIPENCIREEGTSKHYIQDDALLVPDEEIVTEIKKIFEMEKVPFTTGGTWTTDAFFRETKTKRDEYAGLGITAVEMECSAIFALGVYRDVHTCSILVVSDNMSGEWKPDFTSKKIAETFRKIGEVLTKKL